MRVSFFITFILCLYDLIPFNGAFDYYDVQPAISEDVVKKDNLGMERIDGYRNLVSNGRSIRNCMVYAAGCCAGDPSPNIIWFGPVDQSNLHSHGLRVDCLMEKFETHERKLLQLTRANLQLRKRLRKQRYGPQEHDKSEYGYY